LSSAKVHTAAPSPRLFGTDGVRGVANQYPITSEVALKLARALAQVFRRPTGRHRRILIGKDTRLSGYMLETAMASGICSMGADVMLVGPMPTPGIAFLTRTMRAAAGVVISASHNPYQDNGIKFFSHEGFKLDDEIERQIEDLVFDESKLDRGVGPGEIGKAMRIDDAIGRYMVFLKSCLQRACTFDGLKVVIDCANGAAYKVGPDVLDELAADVIALGVDPDGKNINRDGGALNPARVREAVLREHADIGVALDGDADRAILVDSKGDVLDGDDVLAIMGRALAAKGKLAANTVVATVMSNLGLDKSLAEAGIRLARTDVGDPAVCREMRANGYNLGGEQSGHVIFMDCSTTGDGLITTLMVLEHMLDSGRPLCELRAMHRFPQVLHNIKVRNRVPFAEMRDVARIIGAVEARFNGRGRVFVRYSGTEMLARVMIEGEDEKEIEASAREIGAMIEKHIGAGARSS
jgi:phosphoglucosamine mutase